MSSNVATKKFEVGVYNKEVRDLVKFHEHHLDLNDDWADIHRFEIKAHNEDEARSVIEQRYPPNRGYVKTDVINEGWE
jgi:hypothetical protein